LQPTLSGYNYNTKEESEKTMGWSKNREEGEVQRRRIDALPICNALDSESPLLELREFITFGKGDVSLVAEIRLEGSIPKDNPPMINILTRAQDSLGCIPINVDAEVFLKGINLYGDIRLQLHRVR